VSLPDTRHDSRNTKLRVCSIQTWYGNCSIPYAVLTSFDAVPLETQLTVPSFCIYPSTLSPFAAPRHSRHTKLSRSEAARNGTCVFEPSVLVATLCFNQTIYFGPAPYIHPFPHPRISQSHPYLLHILPSHPQTRPRPKR
jgi:hypothetical protein